MTTLLVPLPFRHYYSTKELDLAGVEDKEDELRRFLAVAAQQEAKGETAVWFWCVS